MKFAAPVLVLLLVGLVALFYFSNTEVQPTAEPEVDAAQLESEIATWADQWALSLSTADADLNLSLHDETSFAVASNDGFGDSWPDYVVFVRELYAGFVPSDVVWTRRSTQILGPGLALFSGTTTATPRDEAATTPPGASHWTMLLHKKADEWKLFHLHVSGT